MKKLINDLKKLDLDELSKLENEIENRKQAIKNQEKTSILVLGNGVFNHGFYHYCDFEKARKDMIDKIAKGNDFRYWDGNTWTIDEIKIYPDELADYGLRPLEESKNGK